MNLYQIFTHPKESIGYPDLCDLDIEININTNFLFYKLKDAFVNLLINKILLDKELNNILETGDDILRYMYMITPEKTMNILLIYLFNLLYQIEKISIECELFEVSNNINKFIDIFIVDRGVKKESIIDYTI